MGDSWEIKYRNLKKTLYTFLVISKTVGIYEGFEMTWNFFWLHGHSLPIRLLPIGTEVCQNENIDFQLLLAKFSANLKKKIVSSSSKQVKLIGKSVRNKLI